MTPPRRKLSDALHSTVRTALARAFDEAEAAGDLVPLDPGTYRCRVTEGRFTEAKDKKTPGYALTFVVDEGEHRGRRLWHTCYLTPAAMAMSKRDLRKLGITTFDMLDDPLPAGMVAAVKVVLRVGDDGVERNRVVSFDVVEVLDDPTADPHFGVMPEDDKEGGNA